MRSVKKLLKKAMVFTLTAAMLVGTPLTASAAPLNSVYSISDHWGVQQDDGDDSSHTGTVTNTATNTNTGVLKDNETRILGIALDKKHLDVEVGGKQETLTATILVDATAGELQDKYGEDTERILKDIAKMIRWEVQNSDGKVDATTNQRLSIRVTTPGEGDGSQITLNPRMGTEEGKDMIVKATIDGEYYIGFDENDKPVAKPLETNKTEGYSAEATVSIKEYTNKLSWSDGETETETYVKHTVDLGTMLVRDPKTANDTITWTSTNTSVATVTAKGVVTIKNISAKNLADPTKSTCKIIAMGEHKSAKVERTIKVTAGTPASSVNIFEPTQNPSEARLLNKQTISLDVTDDGTTKLLWGQMNVKVKVVGRGRYYADTLEHAEQFKKSNGSYNTIDIDLPAGVDNPYVETGSDNQLVLKNGKDLICTDIIGWTSSKPAVATVASGNDNGSIATVTLVGVGTAKITAKTTSGKSAYVNIKVAADLKDLKIGGISPNEKLYSGEVRNLTVDRTPAQNNDAVKWSIEKVKQVKNGVATDKEIANPNAKINNKGVLTIVNKIDPAYPDVRVTLLRAGNANKGIDEIKDTVSIKVAQSSIDRIDIASKNESVASVYFEGTKKKNTTSTQNIAVPLKQGFKATVTAGANTDASTDVLADTLVWTASGKDKIVKISGSGADRTITAVGAGTATIKVSGLRAIPKSATDNTTKSVSKIEASFKVTVKQPVETITMNKPSVTLAYATQKKGKDVITKSQNVALKVTLGPKGVARTETVTWKVEKPAGTTDGTAVPTMKVGKNTVPTNKLSATFKLDKPEIGDEYIITATSSTGVSAKTTVEIVSKTQSVEIAQKAELDENRKPVAFVRNKAEIKIGEELPLYTFVNVGTNAKDKADWKKQGETGTGYKAEGVTYSVNKKGIVSIDSEGKVVGLAKGTVKITAKTPMGKSKAITVNVVLPTNN